MAASFVVCLFVAAGAAAGQAREPLGAYPPGMPGGQVPLGTYPSNRPPTVPDPAGPSPLPPALADDKANYCLRNPAVCAVREPETHDILIERQKAFQDRMRALELEIERGRSTRP